MPFSVRHFRGWGGTGPLREARRIWSDHGSTPESSRAATSFSGPVVFTHDLDIPALTRATLARNGNERKSCISKEYDVFGRDRPGCS